MPCYRISCYDLLKVANLTFTVEYEREDDGRWLAEVVELPGVLAYGVSSDEAITKAQALALRVLAYSTTEMRLVQRCWHASRNTPDSKANDL
jgi:hypothetical protein